MENVSIIYGVDEDGNFQHVDDVANGLACGCFCPDPDCHQPLIARNGGEIVAHHFAHKQGTCSWAIENVVAKVACDILNESKRFVFPDLIYEDYSTYSDVLIAKAQSLPITGARLENLSGRRVPEIVINVPAGKNVRTFAIVISLIHELQGEEFEELVQQDMESIELDLKTCATKKRKAQGQHYNREELYRDFQTSDYLRGFLLGDKAIYKDWLYNKKQSARERESRQRSRIHRVSISEAYGI